VSRIGKLIAAIRGKGAAPESAEGSGTGALRDEDVPFEKEAFTAFMADRFRQAMPGWQITIAGPLTLKVVMPDGDENTSMLNRAHEFCLRNRRGCAEWLDDYVTKMRDYRKDAKTPLDRGMLRIVVRMKRYIEAQQARERGDELVVEPVADDLAAMVYFDLPTAMRTVMAPDLSALGLNRAEALAQAKANLAADRADFEAAFADPEDEIGMIEGDAYQSSWFALPEAWSSAAALFDGKLIAAVPGIDTLLYARDTGPDSVDALRDAAEDMADRNERPISTSVYRWTAQGWQRA